MAERSSALDLSSGVVRMWVRITACPVAALVSLSKILNHNSDDPVCSVYARKRTQDTYREREGGLPLCFWIRALSTQQGGYPVCARYKSSVLLILLLLTEHRKECMPK